MESSVLLARIIGSLFIVISLGVLINTRHYRDMTADFLNNPPLYYLSGAMAFVTGVVMIHFHNLWVADWRVIITLIGWLSLVKGGVRILLPKVGMKFASSIVESDWPLKSGMIVILIIGLWLAFEGFRN